jgi:hypothetical protein
MSSGNNMEAIRHDVAEGVGGKAVTMPIETVEELTGCRAAVVTFLRTWQKNYLVHGMSHLPGVKPGGSIYYGSMGSLMAEALPKLAAELSAEYWEKKSE